MTPTVLIHFDSRGEIAVGALNGIRVVYVDERAPGDRVYEAEGGVTPEWIDAVIAGATAQEATLRLAA